MIPCISQVTTLSTPFEDDLPAFSRSGWPAVELWLTKLEAYLDAGHTAEEARAFLADNGLTALAAAGQGGLLLSRGGAGDAWDLLRRRLDLLAALGVPTLVVAADSGGGPGAIRPEDYGLAAQNIARAAGEAAARGVRLAIEPQKSSAVVASLDTALALVAQSGAANAGVCLDLFHFYTGPSKFEDLAYLSPENLAWVQLCDLAGTPRELAGDADRILPGEGDFGIGPILDHLARVGYAGGVSLEVLNPNLWQTRADFVADAGLRATLRTLGAHAGAAPGGQ
jgi:sugar phosphate isomerase/epimerase